VKCIDNMPEVSSMLLHTCLYVCSKKEKSFIILTSTLNITNKTDTRSVLITFGYCFADVLQWKNNKYYIF